MRVVAEWVLSFDFWFTFFSTSLLITPSVNRNSKLVSKQVNKHWDNFHRGLDLFEVHQDGFDFSSSFWVSEISLVQTMSHHGYAYLSSFVTTLSLLLKAWKVIKHLKFYYVVRSKVFSFFNSSKVKTIYLLEWKP